MFNLLPQDQKKRVESEYRFRLVATALLLFGALGTIAITTLIPSFSLSYQKAQIATDENTSLKKEISLHSEDDFSGVLSEARDRVAVLEEDSSEPYYYELVSDIVRNKTSAVQILGIYGVREKIGGRRFTIAGTARNRDSLLAFVKVLEHEDAFSDVSVPVSNFAAATDVDFSIFVHTK